MAQEILKMRVNINDNKKETEKLDKKDLPKWFETKYVAGGQRDIEFLKFFYENKSSLIDKHEKDKKQLLFKRLENVFFKLDQIVNILSLFSIFTDSDGPPLITSTTVIVSLYIMNLIPIPPKCPTKDSFNLCL